MADCTDQRACRAQEVLPAQYDVIVHVRGSDTGYKMCYPCLAAAFKQMGYDIDVTVRRIDG